MYAFTTMHNIPKEERKKLDLNTVKLPAPIRISEVPHIPLAIHQRHASQPDQTPSIL